MARLNEVEIISRASTKKLSKILRKKARNYGVTIANSIIDDYIDTLNMMLVNGDTTNISSNTLVFCFRFDVEPEQFQKIINSFFDVVTEGKTDPWKLDIDSMNKEMDIYRQIEKRELKLGD